MVYHVIYHSRNCICHYTISPCNLHSARSVEENNITLQQTRTIATENHLPLSVIFPLNLSVLILYSGQYLEIKRTLFAPFEPSARLVNGVLRVRLPRCIVQANMSTLNNTVTPHTIIG